MDDSANRTRLNLVESTEQVAAEFYASLNDIAGTHHAGLWGLRLLREHLASLLAEAPDPDADFIVGHGDPNTPEGLGYQRWRVGSIPDRLADGGIVARQLGQQWAVLVASRWEHEYRPRLAAALEVPKNELAVPIMGDVVRMRNDIVHHHGVATLSNACRAEVLTWCTEGEPISITTQRVSEFMAHFGLTMRAMHDTGA
jgi:hypothetical protein